MIAVLCIGTTLYQIYNLSAKYIRAPQTIDEQGQLLEGSVVFFYKKL